MTEVYALGRCAFCGVYPWNAPLGEFCEGDDLHQFSTVPAHPPLPRPAGAVEPSPVPAPVEQGGQQ